MEFESRFKQWCIVELFGHTRIAGLVTEETIGGQSFVRVDVPECGGRPAFTKLLGQGAIYALSPVEERIARAAARRFRALPISEYTAIPPPSDGPSTRDYDEDDEGDY